VIAVSDELLRDLAGRGQLATVVCKRWLDRFGTPEVIVGVCRELRDSDTREIWAECELGDPPPPPFSSSQLFLIRKSALRYWEEVREVRFLPGGGRIVIQMDGTEKIL
jgi:hypothetical protein